MASVKWINGIVKPALEGPYFVIIEARHDVPSQPNAEQEIRAGDVHIIEDYYDPEMGFMSIGNNNPFWKILAWAMIRLPYIPKKIEPRVTNYFGVRGRWENGMLIKEDK